MDGNQRFVAGKLTSFRQLAQDRRAVAMGQSPFAVIVSCSDSRVPPEIVFDQTFGQLFVIRTAGQVLDEAARSSISYGVDYLKAPLLVVLGHSGCGAVEAAVAAIQGEPIPGYAYVFAEGIGPAVQRVLDQPGDLVDNAVRANVTHGCGAAADGRTDPGRRGAQRAAHGGGRLLRSGVRAGEPPPLNAS